MDDKFICFFPILVFLVRLPWGQQVILDTDVANLYGVETKRINEAIRNNPEKFPEGYVITLTESEKTEVVEIFDHLKKLK